MTLERDRDCRCTTPACSILLRNAGTAPSIKETRSIVSAAVLRGLSTRMNAETSGSDSQRLPHLSKKWGSIWRVFSTVTSKRLDHIPTASHTCQKSGNRFGGFPAHRRRAHQPVSNPNERPAHSFYARCVGGHLGKRGHLHRAAAGGHVSLAVSESGLFGFPEPHRPAVSQAEGFGRQNDRPANPRVQLGDSNRHVCRCAVRFRQGDTLRKGSRRVAASRVHHP